MKTRSRVLEGWTVGLGQKKGISLRLDNTPDAGAKLKYFHDIY